MAGTPSKTSSKTAAAKKKKEKPHYTCMCCLEDKVETDFYKSLHTRVWNYSNKRVLVCKACMDSLMSEYSARYGEQNALIVCCALLDIPFYGAAYKAVIEKNSNFTIGMYTRMLNGSQYKQHTFANTLIDGELSKREEIVRHEQETGTKWSVKDKQNKNYVTSIIGYDPFDDMGMTEYDRKYCFNILSSYCDTDDIRDDGHKIQSVIELTQLQLQCKKINELFNSELMSSSPDETTIKNLSGAKSTLLASISKIAQDNNINSGSNGTSKQGKSAISCKMKDMLEDGFDAVKVSLYDINTSAAMKQIADLSNQSIMEQLTWDANEYTQMIKEQRETLLSLREIVDRLMEENRILKNQIALSSTKRG
ncbi:MAG: hypothetical protein RSB38_03275 [Oscillospiraceae bacterium]